MLLAISRYLSISFICILWPVHSSQQNDVAAKFREYELVPDILTEPPAQLCTVNYSTTLNVSLGNELTPTQVQHTPTVTWNAEPNAFHTLTMIDTDVYSKNEPKFRSWLLWLVGNIPGNDVCKGEVLAEYIGAGPAESSDLHRIVFLVYKQPGLVNFSQVVRLKNNSGDGRISFKISGFAQKYNLGNPIAGNFFEAQWDSHVLLLHKQIGH